MKIDVKFTVHACALTTVILWALANVLTRIAVTYFSPESISFLRCLIAASTLVVYAYVKKMRLPALNDVPLFFFGGAIGFALFVHVFNIGSKTVTASVISFILNATPVITAALARIILKERIGTVGWVCVTGAFIGVGIIT
ncbi:MAG: DMT family transporter, partial [Sporomusa sp.]